MKFSQRIGKTPIRTIIQEEQIDEILRNHLWNTIIKYRFISISNQKYWDNVSSSTTVYSKFLWSNFFNKRIDELPETPSKLFKFIKDYYFASEWYEKFDLIEFLCKKPSRSNSIAESHRIKFINNINSILERELSPYRLIENQLVKISSKEELKSIEESIKIDEKYKPVKNHLIRAIDLFSNRKSPDYRNSIKESISAIESLCSIITENPKSTLGTALKEIEDLHPALKSAFTKLYGYTSDAKGIRHSLIDEDDIKQEEAKFMLVSCSAFVNYLIQKTGTN